MKTFKKALSVILGLALMLSCVMGMQVSVAAEEGTEATALKIAVGDATVVDSTVTVPIEVVSNPGFTTLAVEVGYDHAILQLDTAEKDASFSTASDAAQFGPADAETFRMMWAFWGVDGTEASGNGNVTATGTIATLTFTVLDKTVETADITLEVTEAGNVLKEDILANVIANDGTVTFTCKHTDKDSNNLCDVCGDEIIVTNTSLKYKTSAYVADKFGFYADFSRAQLDAYDDFYIEVATEHYRMTDTERYKKVTETVKYKVIEEGETAEGYLPQYEVMSATYRFLITGVTGYEMTLKTTITIYLYEDGEIVEKSSPFVFTYASVLEAAMPTASDKLKTAIVDLVNYGTESQKYFASDSSNAGSDLALSTDYPNANFDEYQTLATPDSAINLSSVTDNSTFTIADGKSLAPNSEIVDKLDLFIETSNVIRFGFNPRTYGLDEINYKVKYTDSYGNPQNLDVARDELDALGTTGVAYKYGAIALYDSAVNVTVEYYDGTELLATRVVCINDIAAKYASTAALQDILNALVKLGYSTNQLFFG